jgi:hypothetical protein
MTRQTWLPDDPTIAPGTRRDQTSGEWLSAEMKREGVSNKQLHGRLRLLGFDGGSNVISMWRHDATPIALETLPLVLDALRLPFDQRPLWATHFLHAQYPSLAGLLCPFG